MTSNPHPCGSYVAGQPENAKARWAVTHRANCVVPATYPALLCTALSGLAATPFQGRSPRAKDGIDILLPRP